MVPWFVLNCNGRLDYSMNPFHGLSWYGSAVFTHSMVLNHSMHTHKTWKDKYPCGTLSWWLDRGFGKSKTISSEPDTYTYMLMRSMLNVKYTSKHKMNINGSCIMIHDDVITRWCDTRWYVIWCHVTRWCHVRRWSDARCHVTWSNVMSCPML